MRRERATVVFVLCARGGGGDRENRCGPCVFFKLKLDRARRGLVIISKMEHFHGPRRDLTAEAAPEARPEAPVVHHQVGSDLLKTPCFLISTLLRFFFPTASSGSEKERNSCEGVPKCQRPWAGPVLYRNWPGPIAGCSFWGCHFLSNASVVVLLFPFLITTGDGLFAGLVVSQVSCPFRVKPNKKGKEENQ